jgi:diguanylate cyclase
MTQSNTTEHKLSAAAMAKMDEYKILPSAENYVVWYNYVQGRNSALKDEIDKIIAQKMPFTPQACATLYHRYFVVDKNQKMVDDTALNAQKMLKEVLKAVSDFSGETQDYNKDLGKYIDNISNDYGDSDVKDVIKQLVGATAGLKERGEQMSQRLEESKKEINTLRENLQQVSSEAQRDGLTGLYNRRTFERILEEYMGVSRDQKTPLCLIMIDVDHFKKFNDTYGHLLGDEVLKIVARTLHDTLKGQDVVARFGGEEFVAVLPATPIEGALRVADAIRQTIASKELKRKDTGQNFGQITVSLGVSSFRHAVDDIPKLLKRADEALYDSKRLGRNRVSRES